MTDVSYRYTALDSGWQNGARHRDGQVGQAAAHLALLQRGLEPIEIDEKKNVLQFEITKKRVKRKEVMHFSRQLSVFVEAGIPIMEALEISTETRQAHEGGPGHGRKASVGTRSRSPLRRIPRRFLATTSQSWSPPS